jgi:hypothetical protein
VGDILKGYKPGTVGSDGKWKSTGTQYVLGDLWIEGQRRYWAQWHDFNGDNSVFRNARIYLGIMNLYGDPSLRLPVIGR